MKTSGIGAAGALAGIVLLAGCATQVAPDDPVYQRLNEVQQQVEKLQKVVQGQGLLNMASGQQQMEQELATLQGQIQDLQHQYQLTRQREQAVDQDFDQRLAALEQGASAAGIQVGGSPRPGAATGQSSGAAPGVVAVPGAATGGAASGQASDYAAYQAAFAKLRAGDDAAAVNAFKAFIQQYPDSRFAPNAWYWMGGAHYVNGEYQDAISAYRQLLDKYPDSPKAAESYLKVGYAQYALKDYKSASATFKDVISKYPGTTAADLAQQRLKQMGTPGQ